MTIRRVSYLGEFTSYD